MPPSRITRERSSSTAPRSGPPRSLRVEIRGVDLPGRSCGPTPGGGLYKNIHVGLKKKSETVELVPGDATHATWRFEIAVRTTRYGLDFGGPFVSGRGDDRHLGLRWGTLGPSASFTVFRGAKLRLSHVRPALVLRALRSGSPLVATLGLTDENGWPRCATVKPPEVRWTAA